MTMKNLLLYTSVILLQIYLFPAEILNEHEEKCVKEFMLDRNVIEAWNIEPEFPEDNLHLQQYMSCYWKKLGYLQDNGEINYPKLIKAVHIDLRNRFNSDCTHIVNFILSSCRKKIVAESDGLRAIRMWNCLNNYTENLF